MTRSTAPRRSLVLAAPLTLLLLVSASGLGGCRSVKEAYADTFLTGRTITYDEYLAMDSRADPPPTIDDVIGRLGPPFSISDRDGVRRKAEYHAFSASGQLKRAEFHFDKEERLSAKTMW